jgi:hypothetical protein
MNNYIPKFLYIVKSENNKEDYFVEISYLDVFSIGSGNKFLSKQKYKKKFDIEKYIKQQNEIPLVIFPENTKTNKQAVLNIRSNLMDDLYKIIQNNEKTLLLRSEIIINLNNDINTIFSNGLKSIFNLCKNLIIEINIYSQDISNDIFSANNKFDNKKFKSINEYLDFNLQEFLMDPNHRNIVGLNCLDHKKFINYYEKTSSDKKAKYVKKN